MNVLKKLEEKIQTLFEGGFGRAFKSPVQPVEIARKLVKEMEDHKVVSVSRIYAPNEYRVFLAPGDMEQFEAYQEQLKRDLGDYLIEHARKEGYDLLSRPIIVLESDKELQVGEFGIATRMVSAPVGNVAQERGAVRVRAAAPPTPSNAELSRTMVYRPEDLAEPGPEALPRETATLTINSHTYRIPGRSVVLGRSRQSDIVLNDPNVSRRHAEIRREGDGYAVYDLSSTNGLEVNGKRVKSMILNDGDAITLGTTKVRFERKP